MFTAFVWSQIYIVDLKAYILFGLDFLFWKVKCRMWLSVGRPSACLIKKKKQYFKERNFYIYQIRNN